ncbi:MAG: hypothetical protein APF81_03980 [Desulfosporosinus sp. BRH_c37]|nr:MAG: hypothetical protein APF81_03980 [Desulfosporosinus sp. BRH_c37]
MFTIRKAGSCTNKDTLTIINPVQGRHYLCQTGGMYTIGTFIPLSMMVTATVFPVQICLHQVYEKCWHINAMIICTILLELNILIIYEALFDD